MAGKLARLLSLLGLAGLSLAACKPVDLLNATIPRSGYHIESNLAYGADPRQKLDIYIPDGLAKPAPVVVFFYGGSWQDGHKEDYRFVGQSLAEGGVIAVIPDYRVYPQVSFPVFNEDGAAAFAWVHNHIAHYQGDADALFLAGHSAGAYIAVMIAANPAYLEKAGGSAAWIRGVIGIAGPYDFLPLTDPKLIALFSTADAPLTQPVTYVDRRLPPMLLAHGDEDKDVLLRNSLLLEKKLRAFDSPVALHQYKNIGHIGIILSLARGFRHKTPLRKQLLEFIDKETHKNRE